MTAIAWTENDPVVLSKTVSKFIKDNKDLYSFKAGIVEGKVVDLNQVEAIASLPSKEELISKLLYVINAHAQRIVTVINAVPRNLAVVVKQIGEKNRKPQTRRKPKRKRKNRQPKKPRKRKKRRQKQLNRRRKPPKRRKRQHRRKKLLPKRRRKRQRKKPRPKQQPKKPLRRKRRRKKPPRKPKNGNCS